MEQILDLDFVSGYLDFVYVNGTVIGCLTLIRHHPMKSLLLAICPSVFSQNWIISFF